MECNTNHDQETSNNRRLPLALRRHGNPARQLTRNGEEQEHDAATTRIVGIGVSFSAAIILSITHLPLFVSLTSIGGLRVRRA